MSTRNVKIAAMGLAVAACMAGLPAWAGGAATGRDGNAKAEDLGIVTGLAVGAAAGGPVGALIGAAAGGLLGDRFHQQKQTAKQLSTDLGASEAERGRLAANVAELSGSLAQAQAGAQAQGAQLEHTLAAVDAVGMDVSFRTDDASIKVEDLAPLLKLGALAAAVPDARLRIAGFADPRGSAAYNDALSQRRAEAVAAALACGGIEPERLIIEAHGASESAGADGDLDAYALDRRVTVRLERPSTATPASATAAGSRAPTPGVGP
jgi:outer membrane protein OmpA-like peptidoglycan-associated protein